MEIRRTILPTCLACQFPHINQFFVSFFDSDLLCFFLINYVFVKQDMEFGWRIVVGSFIGFLGAALGSVGGVGGGGIFVPMLTLIIGFDPKSSTAISKCGLILNLS